MEKEKQPEATPGQRVEITGQTPEILEVQPEISQETISARESAEREQDKNLRQQVEQAFANEKSGVKGELIPPQKDSGEKLAQTKSGSILERMGISVGKSLSWVIGLLENRVKNFDVESSGAENLKELEGRPYILAANHVKPRNILMQAIGLSPDSFLIRRVVKEETNRVPNAISNVSGKIRKIPILGQIDKLWSPFREGMMEGAGFIPVKMKRGESSGFNRNFVEKFREAKDRKEPVIIFPQGRWDKDFDPDREFETGAATLSKNYGVPIVPVFIRGGHSWFSKEKASVSIGRLIYPEEKNKEEITGEVRESLINLGGIETNITENR